MFMLFVCFDTWKDKENKEKIKKNDITERNDSKEKHQKRKIFVIPKKNKNKKSTAGGHVFQERDAGKQVLDFVGKKLHDSFVPPHRAQAVQEGAQKVVIIRPAAGGCWCRFRCTS